MYLTFRPKRILSLILTAAVLLSMLICGAVEASAATSVGITYQSQIQRIGWQAAVLDGAQSGTTGKALRLEAVKISLKNAPSGATVLYQTQVQRYGWQNPVSSGAMAGTTGKALRMEAIRISVAGMPGYAVQYRAHVQKLGWQAWITTNNGTALSNAAYAGTVGKSLRIEAIQIRIVKLAPVIVSSVPENVTTEAGTVPVLPASVTVNMSDGTTKTAAVTWDDFNASEYQYGGNFQIAGTIAGTSIQAGADIKVTSTSAWSDGQFLVGTDIPAGEYVITESSGEGGYFEIASDLSGSEESLISADFYLNRDMITVTDGQYLLLSGGIMYKAADAPEVEMNSGTLPDGMYKVGTDIPEGKYTLTPNSQFSQIGAYQIMKDSLHNEGSSTDISVISADKIITLKNGMYLQTVGCIITLTEASIETVNPLSISTAAGIAPILPSTVTAVLSTGDTRQESVTWDTVSPSQYAQAGSFTVSGTIANSDTVTATATVTVTAI